MQLKQAVIAVPIFFTITFMVGANSDLIGTKPPTLTISHWVNSKPISLDSLHGKVVLVRWWTAPDCPFCEASSTALNEWYEKYGNGGLQVIGIYHHKREAPLTIENVESYIQKFGFEFPIGIDEEWTMLKQWWLYEKRDWTSVSFLIDKEGFIQHIHPGGSYVKGDKDYEELETKIVKLLNTK